MYAKLITRQNGNSTANATPRPFPFPPASTAGPAAASTYQRLPTSASGSSTPTTGAYDTPSAHPPCAPSHASEAPAIPPRLYAAWNPSMIDRP